MSDYNAPLGEFQPPDPEEDIDAKWDAWFEQQEKNGYAVISRDEWRAKLDDAAQDGYAEGRKDEREATVSEFAALLPGAYYMDPSDGGNISTLEQFKRMAQDAKMWREHQERARLAVACELRCEG